MVFFLIVPERKCGHNIILHYQNGKHFQTTWDDWEIAQDLNIYLGTVCWPYLSLWPNVWLYFCCHFVVFSSHLLVFSFFYLLLVVSMCCKDLHLPYWNVLLNPYSKQEVQLVLSNMAILCYSHTSSNVDPTVYNDQAFSVKYVWLVEVSTPAHKADV